MNTRQLTRIAVLAALLYVIQFTGSFVLYFEWVNFTILLYGVYLKRKEAWFSVVIFCLLVILTRGIAPWSLMYLLVFPQYALIYSIIKCKFKSEYVFAIAGFVLAFLCGTLIDLPYMLTGGLGYEAFIFRLLAGFQVSLGNGIVTFVSTLFLLKPLKKVFELTIQKNNS